MQQSKLCARLAVTISPLTLLIHQATLFLGVMRISVLLLSNGTYIYIAMTDSVTTLGFLIIDPKVRVRNYEYGTVLTPHH